MSGETSVATPQARRKSALLMSAAKAGNGNCNPPKRARSLAGKASSRQASASAAARSLSSWAPACRAASAERAASPNAVPSWRCTPRTSSSRAGTSASSATCAAGKAAVEAHRSPNATRPSQEGCLRGGACTIDKPAQVLRERPVAEGVTGGRRGQLVRFQPVVEQGTTPMRTLQLRDLLLQAWRRLDRVVGLG
eukprot:CAMPEP_0176094230 /NCGR_PEP_ID=MMETSP0120_2-20121206/47220_1 /TAXON_ID=160619 /ORGANISM="Kryptoperidinium foliaceum, Strain CCMP 1326" /LENGTH=193 /DNA_ID=CAMNT_0017428173 /DNA_START=209 /DNA_END=792 /DNA_ORIENTATION=-